MSRFRWLLLMAAFAPLAVLSGSFGDPGDDLLKKLNIPPSPVLSPKDAIAAFKVAPGFRVELVAAEPLVQDPVAAAFDADGRLWVAEMRGYMPTIDASDEKAPVGRIVVLEDTDGDGVMDRSTVFLDGLVLPRSVLPLSDGVLVGETGKLWWCRSTKNDLKCDDKKLVGEYPVGGNPEYGANSLTPALDNWIYNGHYAARFRRIKGNWVREATVGRGQWGLTQDDVGRLRYNSNSSLLRGDLVPCYSPNAHVPSSMVNVQMYSEQNTYPARVTPGINRYYNLRPDGTLKSVTACCGPCIFRGDALPADCVGNAFICEPAGNLIRRNVFDSGKAASHNAYKEAEFIASTDERFRPVNCMNGPDGALYIVDMYRGIIQHKAYMTPFLRKQVTERGLDVPTHLGRIYRVVSDTTKKSPVVKLGAKSTAELVGYLDDANGWRRDTAQRLLVERGDESAVPHLRKMLQSDKPLGRLHALWTLEGLGKLDQELVVDQFADKHPAVRASAVFLSRRFIKTVPDPDLLNELAALGQDADADVRMQLVFALGDVKHSTVEKALDPILTAAGKDVKLLDALMGGFMGRETEFLTARLDQPSWSKKEAWRQRLLSSAGGYVYRQKNPLTYLRFLHLAAGREATWQQLALLDGVKAPVQKKGKEKTPPRPLKLPTPSEGLDKLLHSSDMKVKEAAEEVAKQLNWPGKDGKPLPVPPPLSAAHQALNDLGKREFLSLCANCHHPIGIGVAGSGPPLIDSDWLHGPGSEDRLIRIVLHGLHDPITINDEPYNRDGSLSMPALANTLNDEKVAGILTYVRREWGEFAPPIEQAAVTAVRAAHTERRDAWTQDELRPREKSKTNTKTKTKK
jgi:glucose/arabinose dehydrogenase/mono/diheme cytochrome c family protein